MKNPSRTLARLCLAFLPLLAACEKADKDIRVYRLAKGQTEAPATLAAPAPRAAGGVRWDAPAGWEERPAGGMRLASYRFTAAGGEADVSVSSLGGDAGGLAANVNRWRQQVGLAAWETAELDKSVEKFRAPAGTVAFVAFSNPADGRAVQAGILSLKSATWFFKVTGPAATLDQGRTAFQSLLKSLRPAP